MSYILDALQKSSAEGSTDTLESQPRTETVGLPLLWKVAIGTVLATNLVFLYLWKANQSTTNPDTLEQSNSQMRAVQQTLNPQAAGRKDTHPTRINARADKKILPGIASPRDLPSPTTAATTYTRSTPLQSNPTGRTFKPTGAPITIADSPSTRTQEPPTATTLLEQSQQTTPSQRRASQLSELSDTARQALYVLTFSFHIFAEDADLRAVVVNGQRLTEGSLIETDRGQEFRLIEILENGVIVEFDHEGAEQSVQIPVMEDWKDA